MTEGILAPKGSRYGRYREYRGFDDKWLPILPSHWSLQKLQHLAVLHPSNVDKKTVEDEQTVRLCNYTDVYHNDFITSEVNFLEASATREEIRKHTLRADTVIITKDSEAWNDIAVPAYVPQDLPGILCGYHLVQLRPRTSAFSGHFLFYCLEARGICDQAWVQATGITRYGLSQEDINNIVLPVPPRVEQRSITSFLDRKTAKVDSLISKKERLIELSQEERSALIADAVTKGIDDSSSLASPGVNWFGEVPRSWQVTDLGNLFREVDERSEHGDEELLTVSHITGVTPRAEKTVHMIQAESKEGYKLCQPGDLVVNTMWAWMGALGIAPQRGIVSPSYNVYRPYRDAVLPAFFDYFVRTSAFVCDINRHSKGIWKSRLRLYPDELKKLKVLLPPKSEQRAIVGFLDERLAVTAKLTRRIESAIDRLREYRTALISAAVTGQIDVRGEEDDLDVEAG